MIKYTTFCVENATILELSPKSGMRRIFSSHLPPVWYGLKHSLNSKITRMTMKSHCKAYRAHTNRVALSRSEITSVTCKIDLLTPFRSAGHPAARHRYKPQSRSAGPSGRHTCSQLRKTKPVYWPSDAPRRTPTAGPCIFYAGTYREQTDFRRFCRRAPQNKTTGAHCRGRCQLAL